MGKTYEIALTEMSQVRMFKENEPFIGGRNSRVFGEKNCDKFITKFGEEFSESPISSPNLVKNPVRSPNLVRNSVTYFVRNVVAHLYLHQI